MTSAVHLLNAVADVPVDLLKAARVRRSDRNWLHAPWYPYHRGGAITVGRTIWFTRKWFATDGYGDGSLESTWRWAQHLAHEVGHLPQAHRFGYGLGGKARYLLAFTWQYASRALMFRSRIHDGATLEIEADRGRWVLLQAIGPSGSSHRLIAALHDGDVAFITDWVKGNAALLRALHARYTSENRL